MDVVSQCDAEGLVDDVVSPGGGCGIGCSCGVKLEVMIEQEMHATLQVAEHATCKGLN